MLDVNSRTTVTSLLTTIESIAIAIALPIVGNLSDSVGVLQPYSILNVALMSVSIPLVVYMNTQLRETKLTTE